MSSSDMGGWRDGGVLSLWMEYHGELEEGTITFKEAQKAMKKELQSAGHDVFSRY